MCKKLEVGKCLMCVNSRGTSGPGTWLIQEKGDIRRGQKGRRGSDQAKQWGNF